MLLIYYGHIANRTNFFYYHYLVMIQATSSINIHVESLITISVGFAFVLTSSSSFAPRDSLSKLSLSSRLVVSSRQAKASKLSLAFWLNEIVLKSAISRQAKASKLSLVLWLNEIVQNL